MLHEYRDTLASSRGVDSGRQKREEEATELLGDHLGLVRSICRESNAVHQLLDASGQTPMKEAAVVKGKG